MRSRFLRSVSTECTCGQPHSRLSGLRSPPTLGPSSRRGESRSPTPEGASLGGGLSWNSVHTKPRFCAPISSLRPREMGMAPGSGGGAKNLLPVAMCLYLLPPDGLQGRLRRVWRGDGNDGDFCFE